MSPEKTAAIDKLAWDLVVIEPQDRTAAMLLIVDGYAKAVRAEYPDLAEAKIEDAVFRYSEIILRRVNELNASVGGAGHG